MTTPDTNLLLLAALGAGGLWLYHDREKQKRATRDALELATTTSPVVVEPGRRRERPVRSEPAARAERIKLASRSYDPLFAEYGGDIPVAYLRALAHHESRMNPRETQGPAWGLLQVIEVVRRDYNKRHHTRYERRDLLDPAVNVAIVADVLIRIIDGFARFHPEAPNLQVDWTNPLFVELLTFGWNAGMSERAGVGHVASYLSRRGFDDFTIDDIHAVAKQAGASPHLSNVRKVRFSKAVTTQYLRERARDEAEGYHAEGEPDAGPVIAVAAPAADEPVSQPSQVHPSTGGAAMATDRHKHARTAAVLGGCALLAWLLLRGEGWGLGGKGRGHGVTGVRPRLPIRVSDAGITVLGAPATIEEAVALAREAGSAELLATGAARQGTVDDLIQALRDAGVDLWIVGGGHAW